MLMLKGSLGRESGSGLRTISSTTNSPSFAGRISFEGASLSYPVPFGDDDSSDPQLCENESEEAPPGCRIWTYSSEYDELETLAVRYIIAINGWPDEEENWFIRNDAYEEGDFRRRVKIPRGTNDYHGTAVASVAAGRDFGVAPGATVIPIAKDFSREGQTDQYTAESSILQWTCTAKVESYLLT